MKDSFYELILDNTQDGIYVLDDRGNYVYVNSVYLHNMGMSKSELLSYNVHDFFRRGQIEFCISDIVYREKRRVVMFQDVGIVRGGQAASFRQLVVSTPVFGPGGEVQNIVAICKPIDTINSLYAEASASGTVHTCSIPFSHCADGSETVVAESPAMKTLFHVAAEIADVDTSVLISGESGTGKEVVAQYIHSHSSRADHELVVINCASLPESLLEAELFGYEKGAFTGASTNGKKGLFEAADSGTLFLDEINSLPLALQGKLLRALETKTIQRLGSTAYKKVDFRLISATNENLAQAVAEKRFRTDLFYRLNVVPLEIPPLRLRSEDIIPLALHFLSYYNKKYTKTKIFAENTIQKMMKYNWPGNVRELKNFVERSVVMSAGQYIDIRDIHGIAASRDRWAGAGQPQTLFVSPSLIPPNALQYQEKRLSLSEYLEQCEREYVQYALETYKSSYAAAKALGTSQSSIMRRKRKYSL